MIQSEVAKGGGKFEQLQNRRMTRSRLDHDRWRERMARNAIAQRRNQHLVAAIDGAVGKDDGAIAPQADGNQQLLGYSIGAHNPTSSVQESYAVFAVVEIGNPGVQPGRANRIRRLSNTQQFVAHWGNFRKQALVQRLGVKGTMDRSNPFMAADAKMDADEHSKAVSPDQVDVVWMALHDFRRGDVYVGGVTTGTRD